MQTARPNLALIVASVALLLAVIALVEIYTPSRLLAVAPVGSASRITQLERKIAVQTIALRNIEAITDNTRINRQRFTTDLNTLRTGTQSAMNQIGFELGTLQARIAKLEEANHPATELPPPRPDDPDITYSVMPGDTLESIARKFNTSEENIKAANPSRQDFARLRIHELIVIPRH